MVNNVALPQQNVSSRLDQLRATRLKADAKKLESQASSKSGNSQLAKASREFASLFVEMMVKEMEKTVDRSSSDSIISENTPMEKLARENLTQQIAKSMVSSGSMPLDKQLMMGLNRQYGSLRNRKFV